MKNYIRTTFAFGFITLKRSLRDPLTIIILFGIPVALLVIFGFIYGGNQELNVRTAIINNSKEEFAGNFAQTLKEIDVLQIVDGVDSVAQAQERIKQGELDTVIELSEDFGKPNANKTPAGEVVFYTNQSNPQTSEIVTSIMKGVTQEFNKTLIGVEFPLSLTAKSVDGESASAIHYVYPMFLGLGLILVGALGIASALPGDRKSQVLRRFKATSIRKSQIVIGTGMAFGIMSIGLALTMTLIAVLLFNMTISSNSLPNLAVFILLGTVSLVGLGLAVGSWAKNPTQGESIGQVIFLASMGFSGIWFPVAMMPEFLQKLVVYMPLTPVIDGIRFILIDNLTLVELLPQIAVILVWTAITYTLSFKLFRWE
jgi:ABC-2 type transport system permease protein